MLDTIILFVLIGVTVALGIKPINAWLRRLAGAGALMRLLMVVIWIIPYSVVVWEHGVGLKGVCLASVLLYLLLPIALILAVGRRRGWSDWVDVVTVCLLIYPFIWGEPFGLPPGELVVADNAIPVIRPISVVVGLLIFTVIRPIKGLGYTYLLRTDELMDLPLGLGISALAAIPIGLVMGFIGWAPTGSDPVEVLVLAIFIYLTVALPEEVLYRGLVQNILLGARKPSKVRWGYVVAADLVYAAVHLGIPPVPGTPLVVSAFGVSLNVGFALMAFAVGLGYGWLYARSRRVMAPSVAHALVDLVWFVLLDNLGVFSAL